MSLRMTPADERLQRAMAMEAAMAADDEDDGAGSGLGVSTRLTTEGNGSDRSSGPSTSEPLINSVISEEPEDVVYSNIQEIIDGLFIGDYTAAIDGELLKSKGITHVVAAMRQRYPVPQGITIHRILIDDTSKTNIIRHFADCNAFIRNARENGKKVLVHCQAGVSRSTTLSAAFLMEEFDLTADDAVQKIAAVRSVTCPAEFFMHQLELYELCDCNPDPATSPEYRRFLMNYTAQDVLDGDGVDNLILAYYPSPAPSPRRSPGAPDPFLSMTPLGSSTPIGGRSRRGSSTSISSQEARSEIISRVRRGSSISGGLSGSLAASLGMSSISRRMSEGQHLGDDFTQMARRRSSARKSGTERADEISKLRSLLNEKHRKEALEVANAGIAGATANQSKQGDTSTLPVAPRKSALKVSARKLRCKMCRRELAAREHILEHEPGQGQKAFAPHRRDMTQHRLDTEKRRQEKEAEREARQKERRAAAAEAAEEILQEAEEAVEEASDDEGKGKANVTIDELGDQTMQDASNDNGNSNAERDRVMRDDAGTSQKSTSRVAQGASPRTLNARLPPALAALRVAMPAAPSRYDFGGSAIDDDEPTPVREGPPSPPFLLFSVCTSYFTEPLSWMRAQLENGEISGKIICPNARCGAKLGSFDWSGLQCSCAAWICPGFALAASKVDEVRT